MVLGPQGPGRVGRRRLFVGTGRPSGGPFCVVRVPRRRGRGAPPRQRAAHAVGAARARADRSPASCARSPRTTSRRSPSSTRCPRSARPSIPSTSTFPTDPLRCARTSAGSSAIRASSRPSSARAARWSGWFQFEEADGAPGERELGYRLHPDTWGEGYATEGAAALLRDAFARPGVTRVYAHSLLANPGSIRVMEKIGMTYAGPVGTTAGCRAPSTRRSGRRDGGRRADGAPAPERPRAAPPGRPGSFVAALPGRSAREGMRAAAPRMRPMGRDAAMGPRGDRPGAPGPHRVRAGARGADGARGARRDRAGSRSAWLHPRRRTRGRGRWCSSRAWRRRRPGRRRAGRSRAMKTRPAGGSRQGRTCVREPRLGVGRKRGAAREVAGAASRAAAAAAAS